MSDTETVLAIHMMVTEIAENEPRKLDLLRLILEHVSQEPEGASQLDDMLIRIDRNQTVIIGQNNTINQKLDALISRAVV